MSSTVSQHVVTGIFRLAFDPLRETMPDNIVWYFMMESHINDAKVLEMWMCRNEGKQEEVIKRNQSKTNAELYSGNGITNGHNMF